MKVQDTLIADVKIIQPAVFDDERGFFLETFQKNRYLQALNITEDFVQDNHSRSVKGVLRGLHFQRHYPQGKLVRVVRGEIYDVVVDIRPESPTYGRWVSASLSGINKFQLWVPPGLAHGFLVLSDTADVEYKCTAPYVAGDEGCLLWNDPAVGIIWQTDQPILSAKDQQGKPLAELTG
ncbi:dTDP-4-dehydrorhamnose 3,5-epimerase [Tatumella terrea]|uniref:dTDP-4-dehydrorhamnose 3,5-epimerase n=1 Tax=Tatumella terrea TaxID=419007 RepID=A0ABW1VYX4_9GAMM|nr:dTDP-4-dehydrorhamnose 3,5-epimerase [Tatumella sp. JGM118]MBS0910020.1 dTDP-4-dehydrorhamnose 3,5-epimerase [Tatumella sp. JGM118]